MEMQEITPEEKKSDEKEDDGGASEPTVETKTEAAEEAEADHYSKLLAQPEDIYSEAFYSGAPLKKEAAKPTDGSVRRYRAVCALLSGLCLILLLVVIILSLKLQNGSTVCQRTEGGTGDSSVPACGFEQCRTHIQTTESQHRNCHRCPLGWVGSGQSCFLLSTTRLNWEDSQRNCSSRGASLATISNQEEQKFLTEKGNMKYWIGLRRDGDSWTWIDNTGQRLSYWATGQPGGGRGCGILNTEDPPENNWIKAKCDTYTYFICQLKLA